MAIYSKTLCQQRLSMWLEAEEAIATGQSYEIGDRKLTRANLADVRREMEYWAEKLAEAELEESSGGRNRVWQAVARDL